MNFKEQYALSQKQSLLASIEQRVSGATLRRSSLLFLKHLIETTQPKRIVEFGSGLSSELILNTVSPDAILYSIDNSDVYLEKTKKNLEKFKNFIGLFAPLETFYSFGKQFITYSDRYLSQIPKGETVDLVLIDGPLGFFHREAPLYQMIPLLKPGTLIFLDDSHRPYEKKAVENWKKVWPNLRVIEFGESEPLRLIQIENPKEMNTNPFSAVETFGSFISSYRRLIYLWKHRLMGNPYHL